MQPLKVSYFDCGDLFRDSENEKTKGPRKVYESLPFFVQHEVF